MPTYTIDLGPKVVALLDELAKDKDTTKAEIIRRALSTYSYLNKATKEGNQVSVTRGDEILKDVVLP